MTAGYKVTELFCITDVFCKHFNAENAGNLLGAGCRLWVIGFGLISLDS